MKLSAAARLAVLAAILLPAGAAFPAQDKKDKQEKEPPKYEMKLKCGDVPTRAKPKLFLEGEAPWAPDGTMLQLVLERFIEQDGNGRIMKGIEIVSPGQTDVHGKKFRFRATRADSPGCMRRHTSNLHGPIARRHDRDRELQHLSCACAVRASAAQQFAQALGTTTRRRWHSR